MHWLYLSSTCFSFKTLICKLPFQCLAVTAASVVCSSSILRGRGIPLKMMLQVLLYKTSPCFSPCPFRWGWPFKLCFARIQWAACFVNRGITYSGLPLAFNEHGAKQQQECLTLKAAVQSGALRSWGKGFHVTDSGVFHWLDLLQLIVAFKVYLETLSGGQRWGKGESKQGWEFLLYLMCGMGMGIDKGGRRECH